MSDSVQPTRLPHPWILQARILEWVAISFSNVALPRGWLKRQCVMYTLLYLKWITNSLQYSTWNSAQCYVAASREGTLENDVYIGLSPFAVYLK